jgi:hypothetical protein
MILIRTGRWPSRGVGRVLLWPLIAAALILVAHGCHGGDEDHELTLFGPPVVTGGGR